MSLLSMTGHGQACRLLSGRGCQVEIRGLNHRFLEVNIRGAGLNFPLERSIREVISRAVERGRVDVVLSVVDEGNSQSQPSLDTVKLECLFQGYRQAFEQQGVSFEGEDVRREALLQILGRHDSCFREEHVASDEASWSALVMDALSEAVDGFIVTRKREGERLAGDISRRVEILKRHHAELNQRAAELSDRIRDRVRQRISRMLEGGAIPEERIVQEAAVLAERADVTEELVRFGVHLEEFDKTISGGRVGRRLDFIVQELGRETNTIGSKAQDAGVQQLVIEIKGELERIREQVQNLE